MFGKECTGVDSSAACLPQALHELETL